MLTAQQVAAVIDHTFLQLRSDEEAHIRQLVSEAKKYGAYSVCVREKWVSLAAELTQGSSVQVCSVIGFPDGNAFSTQEKKERLQQARVDGAHEYDMVLRFEDLKKNKTEVVYQEIKELSILAGHQVLKVIFENLYLTDAQKRQACDICDQAFTDSGFTSKRFLKTSTGFGKASEKPVGATLEDVRLMHRMSQGKYGIKPAGGVGSLDDAQEYFAACGLPWNEKKEPDPLKFRIGSSSLLLNLFSQQSQHTAY